MGNGSSQPLLKPNENTKKLHAHQSGYHVDMSLVANRIPILYTVQNNNPEQRKKNLNQSFLLSLSLSLGCFESQFKKKNEIILLPLEIVFFFAVRNSSNVTPFNCNLRSWAHNRQLQQRNSAAIMRLYSLC